MATEKVICSETAEAGADLSSKQYTLVKFSTGKIVPATAGTVAFALQDAPIQGQKGTYALVGKSKVIYGGNVSAGAYLSSDASGHAVTATATAVSDGTTAGTLGTHIVGIALVDGASGDVGEMLVANGLA